MQPAQTIRGIRACVFDAYGTLFDVHSAVGKFKPQLGQAADPVSTLWRNKQLEYTWLRTLMGRHADFWQITQDALDYALEMHRIDNPPLRQQLIEAYLRLDCYPEVPETLLRLKNRGLALAILSNGTPAMLTAATDHSGIQPLIAKIFSVESVGVFKPHPRVYQLAVDGLNCAPADIVFLSANAWDAAGAAAFGFRVAWVNRFGQRPERLPGRLAAEIGDLGELLDLLA